MPSRHHRIIIRTATTRDLTAINALWRHSGTTHLVEPGNPQWLERLLDRCLLTAERDGNVIAAAAVDVESGLLSGLFFSNKALARLLSTRLLSRAEQVAVGFGLVRLDAKIPRAGGKWFSRHGYKPVADIAGRRGRANKGHQVRFSRSLLRRQTRFAREIRALGEQLGIPADYGQSHRLALQMEARQLSSIGHDVFNREQFLAPRAAAAWLRMRTAAGEAGVELQAVSAFRSAKYQMEILQKKLDRGVPVQDILKVSAAPGYSEHHSGRALDITTPGFPHLEEEFENSAAFAWLLKHAPAFGFRLSFPRGNRHGLAYEPWHWCCAETA